MKPRTSKTVNGVMTTYYLDGSRIIGEETNGNHTVYIYDASGSPIGMQYHAANYDKNTWDVYWYEKNLQGDIIGVCNSEGDTLVSYNYSDAWGNHTVSYASVDGITGAHYNPFRYRGYYYDTDLGMYYLQSRYYDAKICRFISADSYTSTGQGILGNNMFAYCNNDPVNNVDITGEISIGIIIVIIVSVVLLSSCSMSSEAEARANEKYNASTININGNNPNGIIDVTISADSIKILDSWKISNRYEKRAILNTIINSEEYTSDYKDIKAMEIEWSGHNLSYKITRWDVMNNLVSKILGKEDANGSAKDVDINEEDPLYVLYEIVTLGGLLSW